MARYIDKAWLYGTLCNLWDKTDSEDFEKGVFETIIKAPTADVVEVTDKSMIPLVKDFVKDLEKLGGRATCADIIKSIKR